MMLIQRYFKGALATLAACGLVWAADFLFYNFPLVKTTFEVIGTCLASSVIGAFIGLVIETAGDALEIGWSMRGMAALMGAINALALAAALISVHDHDIYSPLAMVIGSISFDLTIWLYERNRSLTEEPDDQKSSTPIVPDL